MNAGSPDRQALMSWLVGELSGIQRERYLRGDVTDSGELEWGVFERDKLLELINWERAKFGKPQVDMVAVMQIEQSAVGHVDYTQKLAIGAAELVLAD